MRLCVIITDALHTDTCDTCLSLSFVHEFFVFCRFMMQTYTAATHNFTVNSLYCELTVQTVLIQLFHCMFVFFTVYWNVPFNFAVTHVVGCNVLLCAMFFCVPSIYVSFGRAETRTVSKSTIVHFLLLFALAYGGLNYVQMIFDKIKSGVEREGGGGWGCLLITWT